MLTIGSTLIGKYVIKQRIGTGGMSTKIKAAKLTTSGGCDMIIANGKDASVLYNIVDGKPVGTRFPAERSNND